MFRAIFEKKSIVSLAEPCVIYCRPKDKPKEETLLNQLPLIFPPLKNNPRHPRQYSDMQREFTWRVSSFQLSRRHKTSLGAHFIAECKLGHEYSVYGTLSIYTGVTFSPPRKVVVDVVVSDVCLSSYSAINCLDSANMSHSVEGIRANRSFSPPRVEISARKSHALSA